MPFCFPSAARAIASDSLSTTSTRRRSIATFTAAMILMLLSLQASAQTAISGTIANDTRWAIAGSPYLVSGDATITNGAILSIDPGVVIFMAPAASLSVQDGGVQAVGTAAQRIEVRSDKSRQGLTPSRGDYQPWTFGPGTVNTRLDHVSFEYGSGISVFGSAPRFDHLDLRNNIGAAITIDLAASPAGVGIQASNNGINGIAVPAGDITGNVRWGLRGIPYVVASGVVSVGRSPSIDSVTPSTIQQGESSTVTVSGVRLSGLASISSATPGVSAVVLPGGSDSQATMTVTVAADARVGTADLNLLVAAGQALRTNAFAVLASQPALTTVAPNPIYVGQPDPQITIAGRNFRADSKLFVDGVEIDHAAPTATALVATLSTQTALGNLSLQVRTPVVAGGTELFESNELPLQVAVPYVSSPTEPKQLLRGRSDSVDLVIPYPAPAGGITIALSVSPAGSVQVPETVVVPAGQTTVNVPVLPLVGGSGAIQLASAGFTTNVVHFNVAIPPHLTVTASAPAFFVGNSYPLLIEASAPAGTEGMAVALSSANPAVATVPATATIPAGQQSVTVTMTTASAGSALISAVADGFDTGTLDAAVRTDSLLVPASIWIEGGASRSVTIMIGSPAPAGGTLVTFSNPYPNILPTPEPVTIAAGQSSVDVVLSMEAGSGLDTIPLTVSATDYQPATISVKNLPSYQLSWSGTSYSDLYVPVGGNLDYTFNINGLVPDTDLTFTVVSSDPSVSTSSATATLTQANHGTGTISIAGLSAGVSTLTLSAPGLLDRTTKVIVLKNPELRFVHDSQLVGIGMFTDERANAISLYVDGQPYVNTNNPINVRFSYSAPGVTISPSSFVIPYGRQFYGVTIYGPNAALAGPVSIDASANGFASPNAKLVVTAVKPALDFPYISLQRFVGDPNRSEELYLKVPGDESGWFQRLKSSMTATVSVDQNGGPDTGVRASSSSIFFPANVSSRSVPMTGPTAEGSFSVTASSTLADSTTAGPVVVTSSEHRLQFSDYSWSSYQPEQLVLGRAMTRSGYVNRLRNGEIDYAAATPLVVNLRCVPAEACSVSPQTATIPAQQAGIAYSVSFLASIPGVTPLVEATAEGFPTQTVPVKVVEIAPELSDLDSPRSVLSQHDGFIVNLVSITGESLDMNVPSAPLRVDLSIVDSAPASIIGGFTGYPGGFGSGDEVPLDHLDLTSLTSGVYQSWNNQYTLYVAAPQGVGSYRVRASVAGGEAITSDPIDVQGLPELQPERDAIVVGRGMNETLYVRRLFNGVETTVGNLNVHWTCIPVTVCTVDEFMTLSDGENRAGVKIHGIGLSGPTPAILRGTSEGIAPVDVPVTVVDPELQIYNIRTRSDLSAPEQNFFEVRLVVPGSETANYAGIDPGYSVQLDIADSDPAEVVPGFFDDYGNVVATRTQSFSGYASLGERVAPPTKLGHYRVRASIVGTPAVEGAPIEVAPVLSPEIVVVANSYSLSVSSLTVGKGMVNSVYISQMRNGTYWGSPTPRTLHLSCAPVTQCQVPATVVIPAYYGSISVDVTGLDVTGDTPATLTVYPDIEGTDYTATSSVYVVAPVLSLDWSGDNYTERYVDEGESYFYVNAVGANGEYLGNFVTSPHLAWELVDAQPANIVSIIDRSTDEAGVTPTTLLVQTPYWLSTPRVPGSYRLRVHGDAGEDITSELVTVVQGDQPELTTDGNPIELSPGNEGRVTIYRQINSHEHVPMTPLTVTLSCVPLVWCQAPPTATIPAGASSVDFYLNTGDNFPYGKSATLTLSAPGYETVVSGIEFSGGE